MQAQMVLAGIGGQGVLFSTKLLAETALRLGHRVILSETHGMSQRGGCVVSHLKIGNFLSPLVRLFNADFLLSFEIHEAYRNIKFLRPPSGTRSGGVLFVNTEDRFSKEGIYNFINHGIVVKGVDANKIAFKLNASLVSNLILLGFACKDKNFPFQAEELILTAEKISPSRFKELNVTALKEGYAA